MTSIAIRVETSSQRPPTTATLSAPAVDAVASRVNGNELFHTKTPRHEGSIWVSLCLCDLVVYSPQGESNV